MPYTLHKKLCFTSIMPPNLTPHSGIIFLYNKNEDLLKKQKIEDAAYYYFAKEIKKLKLSAFFYNLQTSNLYPTSLERQGFIIEKRITYKISLVQENILKTFSSRRRSQINKAAKYIKISVCRLPLKEIYSLFSQTFIKKNISIPYSEYYFTKLVSCVRSHKQGEVFQAVDNENNINAIIFVIWDNNICYFIASATIDEYKKNNALALLHYKIMLKMQNKNVQYYDFEGSMIPSIAEYFSTFGTKTYEYYSLTKYYNPIYKLVRKLRH